MTEAVGVRLGRGDAEPCRFADKMFVDHPTLGRPKKGLVVKAGGQHRRCHTKDRARIKAQARPAVLAGRNQPVINEHVGRARIRLAPSSLADRHQSVGFLDARRHNPAWPVIFEAAPDEANAVAQQCGGERIAFVRLISPAIEREADHGNASGPTARIASISFVTRSRDTTIHARQP